MEIKQERDGDVVIVRLSGRLDSGAAASAEERLGAALAGEPPRMAIDMSDLDYISSAGLRVLLVLAKKVQQQKGKVALGGLVANVREVFAVSGFDSIFAIEPDTDAAIAAVR
jgi:anti-anti-sigma factor